MLSPPLACSVSLKVYTAHGTAVMQSTRSITSFTLGLLLPVLVLAGCQQLPQQGKHRPDGQTSRPHEQRPAAAAHQHFKAACDAHQQGDAIHVDTPSGSLTGHCILMFVPDQPTPPARP
jgi:hypothetical protein